MGGGSQSEGGSKRETTPECESHPKGKKKNGAALITSDE